MSSIPQRTYWPFDEVQILRDADVPTRFLVSAPWLTVKLDIEPQQAEWVQALADKLTSGSLSAEDLELVNAFFTAIAHHPLAYVLPRADGFGADVHQPMSPPVDLSCPQVLLLKHVGQLPQFKAVAQHPGLQHWTWDNQAALAFSQTPAGGHDPQTLFSIARRFHLLNDLEWNETAAMLEHVQSLSAENFRRANALILKQNHFITERCEPVLSAALPGAQGAKTSVEDFIRAEAGHDKLLARALKALGQEPNSVEILDSVVVLMDVFEFAARRNLLAFAMIVDIFERTSFHEKDPLATLLEQGGELAASRQIDMHRKINDEGEHENVALEFLREMAPVDQEYAEEALRLAELATLVIHQLSAETLSRLKSA